MASAPTRAPSPVNAEPDHDTLPGYYGIASFMAGNAERTHLPAHVDMLIVDLLLKASEIQQRKTRLYRQIIADAGDPARSDFARDSVALAASRDGDTGEQITMLDELRPEVDTYHIKLLRLHALLALPEPNRFDLIELERYFARQAVNGSYLQRSDRQMWNNTAGIVSLKSRYYEDRFSRWVSDRILPFVCACFNWTLGHDMSDDRILWFTFLFTCALSSLLPFSFILVLYFVQSAGKRLVVVGVSSLVFALALAVFTNARRNEIFVASCGLLAVEIVFLASNTTST